MSYEVEQKYPVADLAALEARLQQLGASLSPAHREIDLYFAHPDRDFAKTDEALRIRRRGESNFMTYKGPKTEDQTTKTRREIELPLPPGTASADTWQALLEALGFVPVAEVRKSRRRTSVTWQGRNVQACLDDVEQLGTFAELELITDTAGLQAAQKCISSLAAALGLCGSQRRSYLELLLDRSAAQSDP